MLFIETPEVKWKHFLFIPGGTEWKPNPADAKDQCIPEPSYFFLLFPPIIFLPGPKNPPTRSFLKLLQMVYGLFYAISNFTAFCGAWGEREHL